MHIANISLTSQHALKPPQLIACCHEDVASLFSNIALKPATCCDNNFLQLLEHKVITGKTGNNARLTLGEPSTGSVSEMIDATRRSVRCSWTDCCPEMNWASWASQRGQEKWGRGKKSLIWVFPKWSDFKQTHTHTHLVCCCSQALVVYLSCDPFAWSFCWSGLTDWYLAARLWEGPYILNLISHSCRCRYVER